jgi:hypothetical protein
LENLNLRLTMIYTIWYTNTEEWTWQEQKAKAF